MTEIRAKVELRDGADGSPGILSGVLMRYGEPGEKGREVFAPGSLRWPSNGIRIDHAHGSAALAGRAMQPPIMRVIPVVSADGAEVRIEAPLPDTTAARDLAALMRSDPPVYTGLSVEFHAEREHRDGTGRRVIDVARLDGAGLVDNPSYPGTRVEIRSGALPGRRRLWL